jgi:hypothetical protein
MIFCCHGTILDQRRPETQPSSPRALGSRKWVPTYRMKGFPCKTCHWWFLDVEGRKQSSSSTTARTKARGEGMSPSDTFCKRAKICKLPRWLQGCFLGKTLELEVFDLGCPKMALQPHSHRTGWGSGVMTFISGKGMSAQNPCQGYNFICPENNFTTTASRVLHVTWHVAIRATSREVGHKSLQVSTHKCICSVPYELKWQIYHVSVMFGCIFFTCLH